MTPAVRDRLAFGLAVAVNLVVLLAPSPPAGLSLVPGADKAVHALVFAAVAWTGVRIGLRPRALLPVLLVWAVTSELVQHLVVADRAGDGWDVLADAVGTLLGIVAARCFFAVPSR